MDLSICIPTYNRLPYLKPCLNSIFEGFKNYSYEVVIADGGSTDGTLEYLRSLDKVKLIEQGKLTGAIKAFNECFKIAKGKYIYSCADDNIHVADVVIKSCKLMDKEKQIGLVAPKQQEEAYQNLCGVGLRIKQFGTILPKTIMFRGTTLKEIGYFDETFRTYYVDDDSALSVLMKGYTIIFTKKPGLINLRGYEENKDSARTVTRKLMEDDSEAKYFKEKWRPLREKIAEYKRYKPLFFKNLCGAMIYAKWAQPFVKINNNFSIELYDQLLKQAIVFKDKKYDDLKDFYLAQRYPDEVLSVMKDKL